MQTTTTVKELQRRIAVYEDETAYKELFFLLFHSLTKFAVGIVHSKETAEEIVSDVFITIWESRNKLDQIEDLRLYMFVSVKNNSLRKIKQMSRKQELSLDDLHVEFDAYAVTPEDKLLSAEAVHEIENAINALPNRARLIFKLAKEDRMRYKDIASLLHISVKTVDHQLAISLKKIATALKLSFRKKSK